MPVPGAARRQIHHVFDARDGLLDEALYVNALLHVFAHVQVVRLGVQQVHNLLIVDLKVARLDEELHLDALLLRLHLFSLHAVEYILKTALHNAALIVHFPA